MVIVGIIFSLLARSYTERQARNQLINDANSIYDIIINEANNTKDLSSTASRQAIQKKVIKQIGSMKSNFILISKDLKVLYPKTEEAEQFQQQILPKIIKNFNLPEKKSVSMNLEVGNTEYAIVILPPRSNVSQGLKGWIVLYNPVGPVRQIIKSVLVVLMISLIIAAAAAVIAGVFIARGIAKPIIILKSRADALSKLDFDSSVEIRTGDELEELGMTINKMAARLKEYDTTQKRFFQNASHELKTPLMSIQGYAEGLKDGVFDDNDEALDIITEESKRLKGIVEELIFLSKVESQEDFYKFSNESINDVIKNSVEKLKGLSIKSNIAINTTFTEDFILNIDREKITQALINVLGNCLRYAKNEINITTSYNGSWLEISIRDDGEGFADNEARKVFDRFYKGKKGNSGLGLSITKVIIDKHSGSIEASNAPGGGAEFLIRLPIKKETN